jgi:hypothetical protein
MGHPAPAAAGLPDPEATGLQSMDVTSSNALTPIGLPISFGPAARTTKAQPNKHTNTIKLATSQTHASNTRTTSNTTEQTHKHTDKQGSSFFHQEPLSLPIWFPQVSF